MTTNAGRAIERPDEDTLLDERVRPADWRNPEPKARYDLVVVGAGTAGLVAAAGAAGLGARVALVERDRLGGDCLVTGCVPSKALLRSARAAAEVRRAPSLGVSGGPGEVDFGAALRRMRRLRSELAVHDSADRFRGLGVDVFFGEGRFVSPDAVAVGDDTLRFRRAILATGARPFLPAIEGLAAAAPLTSASFFDLAALPRRLAVVGAGPIGCELGQAMARLGSQVTLLGRAPRPLPREEADAGVLVARALERDGVQVLGSTELLRVESTPTGHLLRWRGPGGDGTTECDAILVAVGRTPNLEDLGLDAAGVRTGPGGLVVDARLRTSNPRVWASGDVCLPDRFTHAADASSRMVLRNALFAGRARYSDLLVPHCTYTEPEVARVGLDPVSAERAGVAIDTHEVPMSSVDRAVLDDDTEGFLRVHVRRGTDRIVGATAVGAHAGDLVSSIVLAMEGRLGLARLSSTIHPYPTRSDALRRVGDAYQRTRLTPFTRRLLSAWIRLRR